MTSCKRIIFSACWLMAVTVTAGTESTPELRPSIMESTREGKSSGLPNWQEPGSSQAVYLWDEETDVQLVPVPAVATYLWDDESGGQGGYSQPGTLDSPSLATYLWDEETGGQGGYSQPDTLEIPSLATYLWDPESDAPSFATYLWGGEENYQSPPLFDLPSPVLTEYLWDKDDVYQQVASLGKTILVPVEKEFIVVGKNLNQLRSQLESIDATLIEEFAIINAIAVSLNRKQVRQLENQPNIISVMQDQGVETAALRFSAKGDAELKIQGHKVQWIIHNVGNKKLGFEQLDLSWPAENGQLLKVKINQQVVFSGAKSGSASILIDQVRLKKNRPGTITLIFSNPAANLQENYEFSIDFNEGLTLSYAYHSSLPVQGRRRDTFYPTLIDADMLHVQGVTGDGVGVAIIDTGSWDRKPITNNTYGEPRITAYYDAIENRTTLPLNDENGHGTHIASILASSKKTLDLEGNIPGSYHGIAPDANLIIVRAFDADGRGTYMNVIRAIAYVIAHKEEHNIRVLNLSFSATPMSHYWQDPLNLAVMAAWRAGIVVIVSSGNHGPDPMTVGVPGNVPYVVTVGAMTDHYTPDYLADDYLATFSSAGPTMEGFVKPEITAPGGHMMGQMSLKSTIAREHPEFHDGYSYFLMSGTSQASAVASGVAALMLQNNPDLSPDDVKCRLMASAQAATRPDGSLAYSLFQQGAGLVNAWAAVHSEASGCVNLGLDLDQDLAGEVHFGGPANVNAEGNYYLSSTDSYIWNMSDTHSDGYIWNMGDISNMSYIWNMGVIWNTNELEQNSYIWNMSDFESNGYIWDMAQLEQDGYIWNMANADNTGADQQDGGGADEDAEQIASYIWNMTGADNQSYIWNMNNSESASYIWNMGNIENSQFIWNMSFSENNSYIWNMGYIWNMNDPENVSYIWNMGDTQNAGYIWNMSDTENASYIWNMNDAENTSYIWNMNDTENTSYIWNMNDTENTSYIWNMNDTENTSYIWNMNDTENTSYIWNMNDAENMSYIWNMNDPENASYIWNMSAAESASYIWNMSSAENASYIWNMNDAENTSYIWNMNDAENASYIWNMNSALNASYIWNMSSAENESYIWNMSAMSVNRWVLQE